MNLKSHYQNLFRQTLQTVESINFLPDEYLNGKRDERFGLTLLIRPNEQIKNEIQQFLTELKAIEPEQYYYPNSDMHITVLSIISCRNGFELKQIEPDNYQQIIATSLQNIPPFQLYFKGITASPSAVMIQGFYDAPLLNQLRNNLRQQFKNIALEHTIDRRYKLSTAHVTAARFRQEVQQKQAFITGLKKYQEYEFGAFTVDNMALVFNNWYQTAAATQVIHTFHLK